MIKLPLFYMRYPQKILEWMNRERKHELQLSHLTEKGEVMYWLVDWIVQICYSKEATSYKDTRMTQKDRWEEQRQKQIAAIEEYNKQVKDNTGVQVDPWMKYCNICQRVVRKSNYFLKFDMCKRCERRTHKSYSNK